jgi:hypothetical protein
MKFDIFFDGQPSDWADIDSPPSWQTFSFLVIKDYQKFSILEYNMIKDLAKFKKWSTGNRTSTRNYHKNFKHAFYKNWSKNLALLNVISLNHNELKKTQNFTLKNWTDGILSMGFGIYEDDYGIKRGRTGWVDFNGYHEYDIKQKKLFSVLPLVYSIRSLYYFYNINDFPERTCVNLYHDPISGDDVLSSKGQQLIKDLVIYQYNELINVEFVQHLEKEQTTPDLIVDNTSGLFNTMINSKNKEEFKKIEASILQEISWNILTIEDDDYSMKKVSLSDFS